jgi:hypothetical protein
MKHEFLICFGLLFLLMFFSCSVSAYQKKMAVDECLFSFNEIPDGSDEIVPFAAWDEASHSGVFMKIKNNNLFFGENEDPDYEYTFYQNGGLPRDYFNNFGYVAGKESSLPILNVVDGKENDVYIKCTYVIGNYRVYFLNFIQTYWASSNLKLTHDFNITKNLFSEGDSPVLRDFFGNAYSYSYGMFSDYDLVDYFYNGNSEGASTNELLSQGFFPFTSPVVVSSFNLRNVPPGFIRAYSLLREGGYRQVVTPFNTYIYVNSSDLTDPIVFPKLVKTETSVYDDLGSKLVTFENDCRGSASTDMCPLLGEGYEVRSEFVFNNPYDFDISGVTIQKHFGPQYQWVGGMGHVEDNEFVDRFNKMSSFVAYESGISFSSGEEKSFFHNYVFDDEYAVPDSLIMAIFTHPDISGTVSSPFYHRIGSDCVDYLGFNRFDTYIELIRENNKFQPVFRLNTELLLWNNMANSTYCVNTLEPDEYYFRIDLENSSGDLKDSINLPLDEAAFEDILGFDCSSTCIITPNDGEDDKYLYSMVIPIKPEYIDMVNDGEELFSKIYSMKNTGVFEGKAIARTGGAPYFKPGNVVYAVDNILQFNNIKRRDIAEIWLFNPSFYDAVVELDVSGLTDEENFTINYNKTINLYPLENRKVIIEVNAIHETWNTDSVPPERFTLDTRAFLSSPEGTTIQENDVTFSLFLNPSQRESFDFISANIYPTTVTFNNPAKFKLQDVVLNWVIDASEDKLLEHDGKSYFVNYSLYYRLFDRFGDEVYNSTNYLMGDNVEYTLDKEKDGDSITFTYKFDYDYDYKVILDVDSKDDLVEYDEGNNKEYFDFPTVIDLCYYNPDDNSQYFYDFFGNIYLDVNCNFFCCPLGTICKGNGFCGVGNEGGCFGRSKNVCNDFSLTNPDLCSYVEEDEECKGCANLLGTCAGYDNSESCEADNCEFHRLDNSSFGGNGRCSWDSDVCIYDTPDCDYKIDVIGDCESSTFVTLDYTSLDSGCWTETVIVDCPIVTKVPFYNWINFVLSILMISVFYYLYRRK